MIEKCVPMPGVCPLKQRDIRSLDFAVNSLFMKLFRTSDISVAEVYRDMFHFEPPSATLAKRANKFVDKYAP